MALSPVDFAAYSRATGTPYPEDPEEKAELASEVLEFRRNQLRGQQEESNVPGILGAVAAGLGTLAAGTYGLTRLGRRQAPAGKMVPSEKQLQEISKTPLRRNEPAPSKVAVAQPEAAVKSSTVDLSKLIEVPFSDVTAPSRTRSITEEFDVPPAEVSAQSFAKAAVDDLVNIQQRNTPAIAENALDSLESGADQLDTKLESVVQRDVDSVRYSKPIVAVEKYTGAVEELTPRQERLMAQMGAVGAPRTDLNSDQSPVLPAKAMDRFMALDLSDGVPEHQQAALGNFLRQQEARNTPLAGFNLSGARGDLPGVSQMSPKERKIFGKQIGLDLRPSKDPESAGFFGADVDMSDFEGPVQGPAMRSYALPQRTDAVTITNLDRADRISAAANFKPGSYEHQLLLNPTVPTEKIRGLLGSTLRVEQGRVGTNLTHEITPGARASMTEVPGWKDEQAARRAQMGQKVVYDEYEGDTPYIETVSWDDYEGATDLGEGEGPGGLTLSRTFDERTGKSRTNIPGQYQLAYGGPQSPRAVRPLGSANQELYARQERIDRVMPTRSTEEGDTSRGFKVDSETGRLTFEGASERDPVGRLRPTDPTMMVEGDYEDRLVTRLIGGVQPATGAPSAMVSTQPTTARRSAATVGPEDARIVKGSDGRYYAYSSATEVTGEEPLIAQRGTRTINPDGSKGSFIFLKNQKPQTVSLPLATLTELAEEAKDQYLNNPSVKREFLARRHPNLLEEGMMQGKVLSDMGNAISYNDFIIESLDKSLQARGYKLPILQPQISKASGNQYYPKTAHEFMSNVIQVTKESPVFGRPVKINEKGGLMYERTVRGRVPSVDMSKEARPIPGQVDIRGTGGVDPMSIASDYEGATAYLAPRLEAAPQVVRNRFTGELLTAAPSAQSARGLLSTGETVPQMQLPPGLQQSTAASLGTTGQKLVNLRRTMETSPVGYQAPYISNIGGGFIANTDNPFTSNARYVSGPVGGPLPRGEYVQVAPPKITRFGYMNPNEVGVGASRPLNLGPDPDTISSFQGSSATPASPGVGTTYNIEQVMKQLQAQAGRRRGSRRS